MAEFNYEKMAKDLAEKALDTEYKGKSIRVWIEQIKNYTDVESEVAREIFAEVEKILPSNLTVNGTFYRLYLKDALAVLKKKYIGDQNDDNTKRT